MDALVFCGLKRVFGWFERGNYEQKLLQIRNFQVNLTRLKTFNVSACSPVALKLGYLNRRLKIEESDHFGHDFRHISYVYGKPIVTDR